jgi:hypothetical protein
VVAFAGSLSVAHAVAWTPRFWRKHPGSSLESPCSSGRTRSVCKPRMRGCELRTICIGLSAWSAVCRMLGRNASAETRNVGNAHSGAGRV